MGTKTITIKIGRREFTMILTTSEYGSALVQADTATEAPGNHKTQTRILGFKGNRTIIGTGVRNVEIARAYPSDRIAR